jgi:hypothetical protein
MEDNSRFYYRELRLCRRCRRVSMKQWHDGVAADSRPCDKPEQTPSCFMHKLLVGVRSPLHIIFVRLKSHLHTVFVNVQLCSYIVFVSVPSPLDIAFFDLLPCLMLPLSGSWPARTLPLSGYCHRRITGGSRPADPCASPPVNCQPPVKCRHA